MLKTLLVATVFVGGLTACAAPSPGHDANGMAREYARQLHESAQQMARMETQLKRAEEQQQRMEALMGRWETQANRYDALLDRWEREGTRR